MYWLMAVGERADFSRRICMMRVSFSRVRDFAGRTEKGASSLPCVMGSVVSVRSWRRKRLCSRWVAPLLFPL